LGPPLPYDTSTYTRVDANTLNISNTKDGKVISTITGVVSQDGKTYTLTTTGTNANGQPITNISVYDKQ
jgi:hypothetical protein